jgi:hypothetical protein
MKAGEQRQELRHPATGQVTIRHPHGQVQGQLLDVSPSGFRMTHRDATLEAGQFLQFTHAGCSGRARVVWNRIIDGVIETGFLIVPD